MLAADQSKDAGRRSNTDETGNYTVFVRDDKIGALVCFRITLLGSSRPPALARRDPAVLSR